MAQDDLSDPWHQASRGKRHAHAIHNALGELEDPQHCSGDGVTQGYWHMRDARVCYYFSRKILSKTNTFTCSVSENCN